MGYTGKLAQKLEAQQLRSQGYSYKEILEKIPVSKDTISRWCRDIILSESQKLRLLSNKSLGQRKGSLVAADNKRTKRLGKISEIKKSAIEEIAMLSDRERFVAGVALYAAEGTKADKHGAFSNADPLLIKFMTEWFLIYAKVPKEKLRGRIWLHEGLDEAKSIAFWSQLTQIPENQFIKTYRAKSKPNSNKIRKNIHEYGVFAVSFSDAAIHRRIMGWISGVFDDKIST